MNVEQRHSLSKFLLLIGILMSIYIFYDEYTIKKSLTILHNKREMIETIDRLDITYINNNTTITFTDDKAINTANDILPSTIFSRKLLRSYKIQKQIGDPIYRVSMYRDSNIVDSYIIRDMSYDSEFKYIAEYNGVYFTIMEAGQANQALKSIFYKGIALHPTN